MGIGWETFAHRATTGLGLWFYTMVRMGSVWRPSPIVLDLCPSFGLGLETFAHRARETFAHRSAMTRRSTGDEISC
jgi:hypothetical protein